MKFFTRIDGDTTKQTVRIFIDEMRADKVSFATFATIIPIINFSRYVFMPLMMSFILQSLITHPTDIQTPLRLIAVIVIAGSVSIFFNNLAFTKLFNHEERVHTRLTERAMTNLMSQSYQFFADHKVGSLSGDVYGFAKSYQTVMDTLWMPGCQILVNYVSSLVVIAFLAPVMLAPLLALTVGVIILSIRSLNARSVYRNQRKTLVSQLNGTIADILGNQILARVFARETHEIATTVQKRKDIQAIAQKEIRIIERESIYRQLLLFVFQTIVLLLGIYLFARQQTTVAALVFVVTYLGRVTDSMYGITNIIRTVEQGFLDAAPITRILHQPIDVVDQAHSTTLDVARGSIELRDVGFRYSDAVSDPVFSHLNLIIPEGQKIGLAGHSGGGKTTLTKILLRFADIDHGEILIDGHNIASVSQASLRHSIAYVPQEPFLFHRSLRENIAYGKPGATDAEIIRAAEQANAMEFIDKLPTGLDTVVGERGVKLSGGQRQRIAVARAILKDAPILILDEATSALDSESEYYIQKALAELMKNRTSIVIAHRLSTIAKLDRIVVLEAGKIVEDGSHTELLAKNGRYAKLWSRQSGGFIEE